MLAVGVEVEVEVGTEEEKVASAICALPNTNKAEMGKEKIGRKEKECSEATTNSCDSKGSN
jgi:predicted RNA binding protein with dsRBD fold (UPF0201 family)